MTKAVADEGGAARGKAWVVSPNRAQLTWDLVDPEAWLRARRNSWPIRALAATSRLRARKPGAY